MPTIRNVATVLLLGACLTGSATPAGTGTQASPCRILITNDDGIHAPGIQAARKSLAELCEVLVVAPANDQSGASHGIVNTSGGTRVTQLELDDHAVGYAVEGSPAEAVAIGLTAFRGSHGFDLVVSGINRGENLGLSNLYSGTVNAAMEGVLRGVPALAISRGGSGDDYAYAASFARHLVRTILLKGMPKAVVLNVNIPEPPVQGVKVVRSSVGQRMALVDFESEALPNGVTRYRPRIGPVAGPVPGDVDAYRAGNITIAPLALDRTADGAIQPLDDWHIVPGDTQ